MSGANDTTNCPNCSGNNTLEVYSDWKPHDIVNGMCVKCGYHYYTTNGFLTKKELKKVRKEAKEYFTDKLPRIFKGKNKIQRWNKWKNYKT